MLEPRPNPKLLSFVIPLYNEEEVFPLLRKRLEALADALGGKIEVICVNDGSQDQTARLLFDWARRNPRVKVLDLSRNFGHQAAITAGLDHASGDAVIVMDGDLQDPPELAHQMLEKYQEGYDIVYAHRLRRHGESRFRLFFIAAFYRLMKRFVHRELPLDVGDFRLMSREATTAFLAFREGQRFIRGMVTWMGFHQTTVSFERPNRAAGTTKYPMRKLWLLAWDGILSFSAAPLKLGLVTGMSVAVLGLMTAAYAVISRVMGYQVVSGWTSLMVLQCVIGTAVLISIGITGEYIGRIYEELKRRPLYIVRRTVNLTASATVDRAVVLKHVKPARAETKRSKAA